MKIYLVFVTLFFTCLIHAEGASPVRVDVLIIGGGASGTTAAIQASRLGVKTLVIEETQWLGGMLTAAGVSAIDGNHQMPAGLWGEFRSHLYKYYGGPAAVETGWVSNTLFEPSVGNKILKTMIAAEKNVEVWYSTQWKKITKTAQGWEVEIDKKGKKIQVSARIVIDATELGDLLPAVGASYKIGMDSHQDTKEEYAPEKANDIIQDLTYVAVLKDYGPGADKTIRKPKGYDPKVFEHACDVADPASHDNTPKIDCSQMITYGKLPNGKYMINWPKDGNDIYLNIIEKSPEERKKALQEAKDHTLRFIYHLQTVLGFKHLGLADDEFDTADKLPFIPYHRESRRVTGIAALTLPYVQKPYEQDVPLYRAGGIVGDYTIDHHHLKNPDAPKIDFVKIKVPSYNVPLGALIPKGVDNFIVAEKSISVSNIVAGATRLQPVVLGIGQAAGALAALAVKEGRSPQHLQVRTVQQTLLENDAYLMPFIDVKPQDRYFEAVQRIGATGILKGKGIAYKWANQTWFYPEHRISEYDLTEGLRTYYPQLRDVQASGKDLEIDFLATLIHSIDPKKGKEEIINAYSGNKYLTRAEAAVLIDQYLNPFAQNIDFQGRLK
ncbi:MULTISPECIES: FAD-dependent oxidoreductase [unclassified Sphingobacterium]|uniref:FAD-dependent oxidoreductase n=1 Tax=unclassified Sphingobacterium TaxID=2609468 RepID=UPI0025DA89F4|nr:MULTISPECIES: FAD-dependent oxidoreductase [unclassified Sphingobacterium]